MITTMIERKANSTITNIDTFAIDKHEQYFNCYHELHTRPFPVIKGKVKISNMSFHHSKSDLTEQNIHNEIAHITELCTSYGLKGPNKNSRHFYQKFSTFELRWERHSEFSSYSFLVKPKHEIFFSKPAINSIPTEWVNSISGKLISALHLEAQHYPKTETTIRNIKPFFEQHRLIGSTLRNKQASIWSAMRLHQDNFNRILLLSENINQCQNGRIIRTLLELESYRNMVLLAYPLAQDISAKVNDIEIQLANLLEKSDNENHTEKVQLSALSTMAATLAKLIATSRYRFDAAIAYYQIVQSRFDELQEEKIEGLQTFNAFIERRLSPALRTIEAAKYRLDDIAKRIDRASDFLRTKINLVIEEQNQALLTSMNKRAQIQLNLQQTVEGLSVIVVTYYLLALTQYILNAVTIFGIVINVPIIIAILLPVYLILIWLFSLKIKKKINNAS